MRTVFEIARLPSLLFLTGCLSNQLALVGKRYPSSRSLFVRSPRIRMCPHWTIIIC